MLKIGTERFYFFFTNFRNSPVIELSWTMSRYFNYYKLFQYATRRESYPKY